MLIFYLSRNIALPLAAATSYTKLMNELPQPNNLQPQDQNEDNQPLYRAESTPDSSFSGYDLTQQGQPPAQPAAPQAVDEVLLEWQAAEYVHHDKGAGWYLGLIAITTVLIAVAFFWTHSWTFIALLVVMAIATGVYARRPPRTLHYALSKHGIRIDATEYHYSDFRAFGILRDEASYSVVLIPVKRFMPAVTLFFDQPQGEQIVDILGARLPMEELHHDIIDVLTRRLRF